MNKIEHPEYYGGKDNTYEAIKVIQAWGLGFELGNVVKYISRNGKKEGEAALKDLKKAKQYLEFEISKLKVKQAFDEVVKQDWVEEKSGPTFDDFLKAKKIKVIEDTYDPEFNGITFKVYDSPVERLSFVSLVGGKIPAFLQRDEYAGDGRFLDKTLGSRQVRLEIVE